MTLREIIERRIRNLTDLRESVMWHDKSDYAIEVLRSILEEDDEQEMIRVSTEGNARASNERAKED